VTPTTGTGFTITPATPQTVTNNSTTSFTVTPASGYGVASVSGCGGSFSVSTYTSGPITANCTISVTAVARNATSGSGSTSPPTITDALKVLQAVVGITPLTATEKIRYDVAPLSTSAIPVGNGIIDAADVILILRRSIGIGSW
jgi:putative alpha-1,2-mannosidase